MPVTVALALDRNETQKQFALGIRFEARNLRMTTSVWRASVTGLKFLRSAFPLQNTSKI